jgi:hypothetical protein
MATIRDKMGHLFLTSGIKTLEGKSAARLRRRQIAYGHVCLDVTRRICSLQQPKKIKQKAPRKGAISVLRMIGSR